MSARQPSATVADVLAEAGFADDAGLAGALEGIRALRPAAAPAPTGDLAALFADASTHLPAIPLDRPAAVVKHLSPRTVKRHRGTMIAALVVAGMGLGATGVAALGGHPFGWLLADPPGAVAEHRAASAPTDVAPPPAVVALEATPPAGQQGTAGTAHGDAADRKAKDKADRPAAPEGAKDGGRPAAVGGNAVGGNAGGGNAGGRELLKDVAAKDVMASPLVETSQKASGLVEDTLETTTASLADVEAAAEVSLPALEASATLDAETTEAGSASGQVAMAGEIGLDPDSALDDTTTAASDTVSALHELARISRGEATGGQAEGK